MRIVAAVGDIDHRRGRPASLVVVERVLLGLAVPGNQPFVVDPKVVALAPAVGCKVEHHPKQLAPDPRPSLKGRPDGLVDVALPFFRMPFAGRRRVLRIRFVLVDTRARAVLADSKASTASFDFQSVEAWAPLLRISAIPTP